ncbi:pancreatic triacylglycerol lipase-like [Dermacentor variabilis]|uniref:pancreatic triacylglycerol lipase-like n=1 Tax=Dermacentor variabilis TaxID=34621 RepID=UPI003F5BAAD2
MWSTAAVLFFCCIPILIGKVHAERNCYGELGCMETAGAFYDPVHRPFNLVPADRHVVNTRFLLHNRRIEPGHMVLLWNSSVETISAAPFMSSRETKFLVHGYLDRLSFAAWVSDMKDAYLKQADVNVIIVDWSEANAGIYDRACANARIVGAELALFIRKLKEAFGADPRSMHIIGHSLGAHIAGYAGANTTNLGRITALDPAEPNFQKMPPEVRLDPTDAEFVDAIHTDSHPYLTKLWSSEGMGMWDPVGHVDFYPNGGEYMPGCDTVNRVWKIFTHGLIKGVRAVVSCNHQRAVKYMLESISNRDCLPLAYECPSFEAYESGQCSDCGADGSKCAAMGDRAVEWKHFKRNEPTRMFTVTNAHSKFCAFQYAVTLTTGKKVQYANGRGVVFLREEGQEASIHVNEAPIDFHPQRNYTFLVSSSTPITEHSRLFMEYRTTQLLFTYNIPMIQVSFRPMTSPFTESEALEKTFHKCTAWNPAGISTHIPVALKDC